MTNLIGCTLGSYRILEQIGTGGMATVYKAYQPSMDRYVAVKVIAPHFARHPTFLQRFRREAQAVARLEHAHILPVYDYGEAEGWPYLVMRYLQGGPLSDRIVQGPLSLREVNRIIGQVGSALDYAHRMGVIHRDVKPSNVLLDAEGNAFLTDFGVARMVESPVQLTGTGVGIGTPAYMSPEQGRGEQVDARTDVYSLGVMLFEMVTGQRPYEAETPLALVQKHISEPLPLPRSIQPDLSEQVERVILRAMAKNPADRFQTAGEVVRVLDAAVQAVEAGTRPTPAIPAQASGARVRHIPAWVWGLLGAVVVFALVAALVVHRLGGLAMATPTHIQTKTPVTGQPTRTPTPVPTPTAQPTPTQLPLLTQQILTQAEMDAVLDPDNWFCFPDRQDLVGVINLPPSFVVQSPLEYVDTYTGRYTAGQILPVMGAATVQLRGVLPRNHCPLTQQAALAEWDAQMSSAQSLTQTQIDAILGVGNWHCFHDTQNALKIERCASGVLVQYPLTAIDCGGLKYGVGQVVPEGESGTAWLHRALPIDQCPQ